MIDLDNIPKQMVPLIKEKLKNLPDDILFPPPIFFEMEGEVIDFNNDDKTFTNKFPILKKYLNPYGIMQGGMIAAAIDNTIGPLSMLVSPPNFTRSIAIKYSQPVAPEFNYIYVTARFIELKKRQLFFEAIVQNSNNKKLASAISTHWIID